MTSVTVQFILHIGCNRDGHNFCAFACATIDSPIGYFVAFTGK